MNDIFQEVRAAEEIARFTPRPTGPGFPGQRLKIIKNDCLSLVEIIRDITARLPLPATAAGDYNPHLLPALDALDVLGRKLSDL